MSNDDERLAREPIQARRHRADTDRALEDRAVTEKREVSDDDRLEMFRMQIHNDALPDLPPIPGYHVCWLTTANPRDSIHRRQQMGYEPVQPSDAPGLEYSTLKTGEYSGMIGVNEMVAFKIRDSLYQRFMQEAHHLAPAREEGKLADTAAFLREQAASHGARLEEFDGNSALRETAPRQGVFAD